jgi:hypothetical protein
MKRIRPATVLLLTLIVVLGYALAVRQRREGRLRAALFLYKQRAGGPLRRMMSYAPVLDWPEGTTLAEAVRRISEDGSDGFFFSRGLPVLVDADGLREAGQTLESPLKSPPKDPATGNPPALSRQLRILLEPLGLAAEVRDGAIVITSRARMERASGADADREPRP